MKINLKVVSHWVSLIIYVSYLQKTGKKQINL